VDLLAVSTSTSHYSLAMSNGVVARTDCLWRMAFACIFPLQFYPTYTKQCTTI
jgi:hypothetical protein